MNEYSRAIGRSCGIERRDKHAIGAVKEVVFENSELPDNWEAALDELPQLKQEVLRGRRVV